MPDIFLTDRFSKSELIRLYPDVARSLSDRWTVMMENANETVAWVGVAYAGRGKTAFFLPHGAPSGDGERTDFAKSVMQAIVRFAKDYGRQGEGRSFASASSAALMADIASDFRDNGLYAVRERIRSRHDGRPDWARTVKNSVAYPGRNGAPVYCEIASTRSFSDATNVVARIQEQVLAEIARHHRWWLGSYFGDRETPRPPPAPWPRSIWGRLLKSARRELYQVRAIRLVDMLDAYLTEEGETGSGGVICGVSDFSTVWEVMLRETLSGVESGWNSLLPRPVYRGPEDLRYKTDGMEIDVVVRHGEHLFILDAKYYRGGADGSVPGVADISKQIIYQRAVESTGRVASGSIVNAFIFPGETTARSPFSVITFDLPDGSLATDFPRVCCQYVSVGEVIRAYAAREGLAEQGWLGSLAGPSATAGNHIFKM